MFLAQSWQLFAAALSSLVEGPRGLEQEHDLKNDELKRSDLSKFQYQQHHKTPKLWHYVTACLTYIKLDIW